MSEHWAASLLLYCGDVENLVGSHFTRRAGAGCEAAIWASSTILGFEVTTTSSWGRLLGDSLLIVSASVFGALVPFLIPHHAVDQVRDS